MEEKLAAIVYLLIPPAVAEVDENQEVVCHQIVPLKEIYRPWLEQEEVFFFKNSKNLMNIIFKIKKKNNYL